MAMSVVPLLLVGQGSDELRTKANQGDAIAQLSLGVIYDQGQGVPQDYAEAVHWFRKAADQGHSLAQYLLGGMYYLGQGVPQDYIEASRWFQQAAEQGNTLAQSALGLMYSMGDGVPQDYVLSHMWLNLAAATSSDKRAARDRVASKMTREQIAEAQRLAREWRTKAAKSGTAR
jgi:hypothetical protein